MFYVEVHKASLMDASNTFDHLSKQLARLVFRHIIETTLLHVVDQITAAHKLSYQIGSIILTDFFDQLGDMRARLT